jgi:hypothetical protein
VLSQPEPVVLTGVRLDNHSEAGLSGQPAVAPGPALRVLEGTVIVKQPPHGLVSDPDAMPFGHKFGQEDRSGIGILRLGRRGNIELYFGGDPMVAWFSFDRTCLFEPYVNNLTGIVSGFSQIRVTTNFNLDKFYVSSY